MANQVNHNGHVNSAAVFGGINMDIWGKPSSKLIPKDSNPGTVSLRPGGVGRNIAHDLRLLGLDVSLIAAIGGDANAHAIEKSCKELGLDLSFAPRFPDRSSSTYLYISDESGDMELAINDMDICKCMTPEVVAPILPQLHTDAVVLDANLPPETIAYLCANSTAPVYADPVSTIKAMKFIPVLDKLAAFKPNTIEAQYMTGETEPEKAAGALVKMGVQRVFLSMGGDGIIAADKEQLIRLPGIPIKVVNANGAGDASMAAIVLSGILGLSLRDTAELAQKAGALTCLSDCANAPNLSDILK
jgi:pseudouridine kinase